ncbi:response regulator/EAL domain protein [Pseudomonas sp. M47T1]|uniref:EAL domain-containing response regulator n=1 Tax=unclassified Pseudomonas TaxID=196821 RepID=UPI0002607F87|nr:EAL domain-containing response regulator [Pseudomonas sp. M47T1]EIK97757.1 response regulator/EAL domain protein [Pseudomonas sp. M47T1]
MHALKVLVLEDSPFQLMALHQMLNASGVFDVLTAESVDAALQSLERRGPVDIAICDLQMEEGDSLQLIRHLARHRQARALIILSSLERSVLDSASLLARQLGMHVLGVLEKPANPVVLHELLQGFDRQKALAEASIPLVEVNELVCMDELTVEHLPQLKAQWQTHFQPKVAFDGRLLGVEALVRWNHPVLGLLSPASFLPLVSYAGLMPHLTWHVLEAALNLSAAVREEGGEPLSVAVNVPPGIIEAEHFAPQVEALLKQKDLPASILTLEMLESRQAPASSLELEALLRLRMLGCHLAIDDFGMGDSNIQRLLDLPFSELKIPSLFVRGMAEDGRKAAVVAGALIMALRMGLDVVVEGVETASDFQALKALGQPALQGYYVARPMSALALRDWMASRDLAQWQDENLLPN